MSNRSTKWAKADSDQRHQKKKRTQTELMPSSIFVDCDAEYETNHAADDAEGKCMQAF